MIAGEGAGDRDMEALAAECIIEFTRAGGPGGQHRNKVETAVRLTHRPTGTVVVASERRSQSRNRKLGLERLAEKLNEIERRARLAEQRRNRRPTRPKRSATERRLQEKGRRGDKKRARARIRRPEDD